MRLTFKSALANADTGRDGVIPGVQIARVGEARGHKVVMTADGIVQYDPKVHPEEAAIQVVLGRNSLTSIISCASKAQHGIKCLMNHSDDIVEVAGVFRKFRLDGDIVRADLHLLKSSRHHDYLLELAQECPEGFGVSINFYTKYPKVERASTNKTVEWPV